MSCGLGSSGKRVGGYMIHVKTLEAIMAARTLIDYCKDHTNLCWDCPFYTKDNSKWTGCIFGYSIPEDWEIETNEEKRH